MEVGLPYVCKPFSISIPMLDCVECTNKRKDTRLGLQGGERRYQACCQEKKESRSPLCAQVIGNKNARKEEPVICKPCRIDLLKCDIGLEDSCTIQADTGDLARDTDPGTVHYDINKDSFSQSDDTISKVEDHVVVEAVKNPISIHKDVVAGDQCDMYNQKDIRRRGKKKPCQKEGESGSLILDTRANCNKNLTEVELVICKPCRIDLLKCDIESDKRTIPQTIDHDVKDSSSQCDDSTSKIKEPLETAQSQLPFSVDTEVIARDQLLKASDKASFTRSKVKEASKIVGTPTTVDLACACRPCSVRLKNVMPGTLNNTSGESGVRFTTVADVHERGVSSTPNTEVQKSSATPVAGVLESGVDFTPVTNVNKCTPCSVRLKLLEIGKCCATLKEKFANSRRTEDDTGGNSVTIEVEKEENFGGNVQLVSEPFAKRIRTIGNSISAAVETSDISDSISADSQASLINLTSTTKKRPGMPSLVLSDYSCKPCSVSIKRLKPSEPFATVLDADDGPSLTCAESGDNEQKSNASPFSLAEHYIPKLLNVRYLNRNQSPLLPTSAIRDSSPCSPVSSDTNDTEMEKSPAAGSTSMNPRRRKRPRKGWVKHSKRSVAKEKHCDTGSDFSPSDLESSSELESSSCENETSDDDFSPVRSSRKRSKGGIFKRNNGAINRPLDVKEMQQEKGNDRPGKSRGKAAKTDKTCRNSKDCFRCPYCPAALSISYKYFNNMITHVYAKHTDVSVDEVKNIIAEHYSDETK